MPQETPEWRATLEKLEARREKRGKGTLEVYTRVQGAFPRIINPHGGDLGWALHAIPFESPPVDLRGRELDAEDLALVASLRDLVAIRIAGSPVGDDFVRSLASQRLETVELYAHTLTDAGLEALAKHPLVTLRLTDSDELTQEGVAALGGVATLRELRLRGKGVTLDALLALRARIPELYFRLPEATVEGFDLAKNFDETVWMGKREVALRGFGDYVAAHGDRARQESAVACYLVHRELLSDTLRALIERGADLTPALPELIERLDRDRQPILAKEVLELWRAKGHDLGAAESALERFARRVAHAAVREAPVPSPPRKWAGPPERPPRFEWSGPTRLPWRLMALRALVFVTALSAPLALVLSQTSGRTLAISAYSAVALANVISTSVLAHRLGRHWFVWGPLAWPTAGIAAIILSVQPSAET